MGDNYSRHSSEMSLDYYIESKVQLLEWPTYSLDLLTFIRININSKYLFKFWLDSLFYIEKKPAKNKMKIVVYIHTKNFQ